MHQSKVISPRVTTKYLVTTLFAHNLSATGVMLHLQVLDDNVDPEKNKTKHTYRNVIQTYTLSVNEPILIAALKVFPQPSHTQNLKLCWQLLCLYSTDNDLKDMSQVLHGWILSSWCFLILCLTNSITGSMMCLSKLSLLFSSTCLSSSSTLSARANSPTQLPPGLTALVILLVEYLQSCIKSLPFRLLLTSSPCPSLIFSTLAKSDGEARQDYVGEAEEMQQRAGV